MRLLFRLTLASLLAVPVLLFAAGWLALEDGPAVLSQPRLSAAAVQRAKALLEQNDPRALRPSEVRTVRIREDDLALALNYGLSLHAAASGAKVRIESRTMQVRASFALGGAAAGKWVNLDLRLRDGPGVPRFDSARIGRLRLPGAVADALARVTLGALPTLDDGRPLVSMLRAVEMRPDRLSLVYEWRTDALGAIRGELLSAEDRERVVFYQGRLAELSAGLGRGAPLPSLLGPAFALARERSNGDAAAENRAVLLVLLYAMRGSRIDTLVPEAAELPKVADRRFRLRGRRDFAQHFVISAGVAALGGVGLSDAVGLLKEVDDARFGSGFSFTDIAADRAGTRFGEQAVASQGSARRLQNALADGVDERELMPSVAGLPEGLSETDFRARFGSERSERYLGVIQEIDLRIDALALYRR